MSNSNNTNKKKSPDNLPPVGDDPQGKKGKFNIFWLYGIIGLIIISLSMLRSGYPNGLKIYKNDFFKLAEQGDVEKISTKRNKNMVRVFIDHDSLVKKPDYYKSLLNTPEDERAYDFALKSNPPQFYFNIIDEKSFATEIADFNKLHPAVAIVDDPDDEGLWIVNLINTILPILLKIGRAHV